MSQNANYFLSGIPLQLRDPVGFLFTWRNESVRFLNALAFDAEQTRLALEDKKLSSATRDRLVRTEKALRANRTAIAEILKPLLEHELIAKAKTGVPSEHRPNSHRIADNFTNLFRDWAWQASDEINKQLSVIDSLLPTTQKAKGLILGAGCGRLAMELASSGRFESLTASEINPLHFLVAEKMQRGDSLELFEIPNLPVSNDLAVQKQVLRAPKNAGKVNWIFNNFLEDNLLAEDFDVVITPWFIDILGIPLDAILTRINRLLKPGGTWINLGPLMFQSPLRSQVHTVDEVLEVASQSGFSILKTARAEITQLRTQSSATFRTDTVQAWAARKEKSVEISKFPTPPVPEFIRDVKKPVDFGMDLGEAMESHQLMAAILELCEDKQSIDRIAETLAPDFGVPKAAVMALVSKMITDFFHAQQGNPLLYVKK